MRRAGLAVALLSCALSARAAEPSADDEARARELFEQGKEAIAAGRFAVARELFQRSVDLVPKSSAAFNLAVALRGMGRPKESHDILTRLLNGDFGELPSDKRSAVRELAAETRRDIAKLVIVARGAQRAELRVDGVLVGTLHRDRPFSLDVNPGERVVSVAAKMRDPVEKRVTLAPGKSARVVAKLKLSRAARRSTLLLVAKEASDDVEIAGVGRGRGRLQRRLDPGRYVIRLHSGSGMRESEVVLEPATVHRVELEPPAPGVLSSPWFWIVAGTLVAGAAVGGYFLLQDRQEEPVRDPEFGVVETLKLR